MKTFSSMEGNENYKPYFFIRYNSYTPVTNVRFSISSLTLEEKETYTFHPIVYPSTATNQEFTWTSSNKNVATVSSSGKVTAKEAGTTIITVKSKANSSAEATCKVTVKLADGDNDEIPDIYDEEPDSIAILTIFSAPPGNGTLSISPFKGSLTGHSFLTLKNITDDDLNFRCIEIPPGEELSFGTWAYEKHNGIHYNCESILHSRSKNEFKGRVSLSVPIGIEQYNRIIEYVTYNDMWRPELNCSSFARGLWNSVVASRSPLSPDPPTNYPLSAGVANSPYELANSIKQYQNTKLYGYMNIYNFEKDIKFSTSFNRKNKGYINEFGELVDVPY